MRSLSGHMVMGFVGMKSLKQNMISKIFSEIPLDVIRRKYYRRFIVPYYHMVNDGEVLHIKHLYAHKSVKHFKDDIDYLLTNYKPIDLRDLITIIKNGCLLPANSFLLTFDDGFREMHDIVAPILLEKGIPATFFINSDFVDNKKLCYQHKASILVECFKKSMSASIHTKVKAILVKNDIHFDDIISGVLSIKYYQKDIINNIAQLIDLDFDEYLIKNRLYLTSHQIEALIKNGFTVGGHSIDHPLYSLLSLSDQLYQTEESVKFMKNTFDLGYGTFAFPHGDNMVSRNFFRRLYSSGLVDVSFGTGGMIEDEFPRNIQRISFEKPLMPAEKILAFQFARRMYKIIKRKGKLIRNEM
jgi:peptidoglycan/xylan/chitin deacetylase (PgdA/CDA1 family)